MWMFDSLSWVLLVLIVGCQLRPADGFISHLGLPRGQPCSVRNRVSIRSGQRERRYGQGTRRRQKALRDLSAALQVDLSERIENGCVLVAGSENYGHMTFKAVALVYEHGEGQMTRAVCVDKGLDFTIGEMSSGNLGVLANNRLFRGGEDGGSVAIMIHPYDIAGARPLGETGLFVGGFSAAFDLVNRGGAQAKDFKFFFNHMAWPEGALEEQVKRGLWKLVTLPNSVLLETKRMRDMELWGRIDFALKKQEASNGWPE